MLKTQKALFSSFTRNKLIAATILQLTGVRVLTYSVCKMVKSSEFLHDIIQLFGELASMARLRSSLWPFLPLATPKPACKSFSLDVIRTSHCPSTEQGGTFQIHSRNTGYSRAGPGPPVSWDFRGLQIWEVPFRFQLDWAGGVKVVPILLRSDMECQNIPGNKMLGQKFSRQKDPRENILRETISGKPYNSRIFDDPGSMLCDASFMLRWNFYLDNRAIPSFFDLHLSALCQNVCIGSVLFWAKTK